MNTNQIKFSCTALSGTGKKGVLPKDESGYRTVVVGGLNIFNSSNEFYSYDGARQLFESSSSFMRRIKSGSLFGELGHPKPLPGQSMESYANRIMMIEETNIACHFSDIWLDFDSVKDSKGAPVIAVLAKVAPAGARADAMERSLSNPNINTAFSIRAFTEDTYIGGVKNRVLKQIITYDGGMPEPGIEFARKYKSPTLESYQEQTFTKQELSKLIIPNDDSIATESSKNQVIELFSALNWTFNDTDKPSFTAW